MGAEGRGVYKGTQSWLLMLVEGAERVALTWEAWWWCALGGW